MPKGNEEDQFPSFSSFQTPVNPHFSSSCIHPPTFSLVFLWWSLDDSYQPLNKPTYLPAKGKVEGRVEVNKMNRSRDRE